MYEERRHTFSFKDIILQLLLVILFIFIMIWLFPTKNYLKENFVGREELSEEISSQLEALYGRLFTDNVESMKSAAQGYFTNERLPQKLGDSVTLTLGEMLEKKLVIPFKDSNNESCDIDKSYVKVTKMDNEYQMKVQLTCSDYADYIIVYMGCYDYCDSALCEAKPSDPTPSKPETPTVNPKPDPTPEDPDPETPVVNKKYEYEYRLDTQNSYSSWGPWSSWSKTRVTANNLRQVEIKREYEITGYKTVTYIDYETHTEYKTVTEKIQTGTKKVENGTKVVDTKPAKQNSSTNKVYGNVIKKTTPASYGSWNAGTYITSKSALAKYPNKTTWNEYISHKTTVDCTDVCKNVTIYTYKKHTRTYKAASTTYSCPSGYTKEGSGSSTKCYKTVTTNKGYSCSAYGSDYKLSGTNCIKTEVQYKYEPIYETITKKVPVTVTEEVEKTRRDPVYGYVNYYRYRTRTQLSYAGTTYKWSKSQNDQTLLNLGYRLTGNKREV